MELIFGLLPLPVAIGLLVVVGVGGLVVRKYVKSKSIVDITDTVSDLVVTPERIDRTVEAILAKLKVDMVLADKIGDFIALIVSEVLQHKKRSGEKSSTISAALTASGSVNSSVASRLIAGPTPVVSLIESTAPIDVAANHNARMRVAERLVKAYAENSVL